MYNRTDAPNKRSTLEHIKNLERVEEAAKG